MAGASRIPSAGPVGSGLSAQQHVVYIYIMRRTQIYLSEEETRALEREARATGRTKSRLIREAIDRVYMGGRETSELLRSLRETAGAWRRREDGAAYVERVRSGRLARIHSD